MTRAIGIIHCWRSRSMISSVRNERYDGNMLLNGSLYAGARGPSSHYRVGVRGKGKGVGHRSVENDL